MFSLLKDLFSSDPTPITSIVKGVGNWIDEREFTEEEKAKADLMVLDAQLKWLAATQGMNRARRFLAMLFSLVFCFLIVLSATVFTVGFFFDISTMKYLDGLLRIVVAYRLGEIVIAIVVFYFGKGIFESFYNRGAKDAK